jgi:hypothetical protein
MNTDCPFLKSLRQPEGKSTHCCEAGINFYHVGKDRERCRVCSIATLGRLPDCGYLDAFAWLESYPGRAPFVSVEIFCGLTDDPLPNLLYCARCPERRPCFGSSLSNPDNHFAHALSMCGSHFVGILDAI